MSISPHKVMRNLLILLYAISIIDFCFGQERPLISVRSINELIQHCDLENNRYVLKCGRYSYKSHMRECFTKDFVIPQSVELVLLAGARLFIPFKVEINGTLRINEKATFSPRNIDGDGIIVNEGETSFEGKDVQVKDIQVNVSQFINCGMLFLKGVSLHVGSSGIVLKKGGKINIDRNASLFVDRLIGREESYIWLDGLLHFQRRDDTFAIVNIPSTVIRGNKTGVFDLSAIHNADMREDIIDIGNGKCGCINIQQSCFGDEFVGRIILPNATNCYALDLSQATKAFIHPLITLIPGENNISYIVGTYTKDVPQGIIFPNDTWYQLDCDRPVSFDVVLAAGEKINSEHNFLRRNMVIEQGYVIPYGETVKLCFGFSDIGFFAGEGTLELWGDAQNCSDSEDDQVKSVFVGENSIPPVNARYRAIELRGKQEVPPHTTVIADDIDPINADVTIFGDLILR